MSISTHQGARWPPLRNIRGQPVGIVSHVHKDKATYAGKASRASSALRRLGGRKALQSSRYDCGPQWEPLPIPELEHCPAGFSATTRSANSDRLQGAARQDGCAANLRQLRTCCRLKTSSAVSFKLHSELRVIPPRSYLATAATGKPIVT